MKPLVLLLLAVEALHGEVTLPAIFSDHAVLQKAGDVPIWGRAEPGEAITVALDKLDAKTVASSEGKWMIRLDLSSKGPGPYELDVQASNRIVIRDVLVGEVWACTGQSNMAFPLSAFPEVAGRELPESKNPALRQFLVAPRASPQPTEELQGKWTVAGPETAGSFSAAAYFFGKHLQAKLNVPVGLVNASVGGTVIETWMSAEALAGHPDLKTGAERGRKNREDFDEYARSYAAWEKAQGRGDRAAGKWQNFTGSIAGQADWKPLKLPGLFASAGLPQAGATWIRRKISVPSADVLPGKSIDLYLGDLQGSNVVYWNGQKVGQSDRSAVSRRYSVRGNLVKEGENVLAVRIFNSSAGTGIKPGKTRFQANHFLLAGEWLAKSEFELPELDHAGKGKLPNLTSPVPIETNNVASYLFNGMINPLIPYAIMGIIWYQVVCLAANRKLTNVGVEDTVSCSARHEGGCLANYFVFQGQAPKEVSFTIHCETGSFKADFGTARTGEFASRANDWAWTQLGPFERDDSFHRPGSRIFTWRA